MFNFEPQFLAGQITIQAFWDEGVYYKLQGWKVGLEAISCAINS